MNIRPGLLLAAAVALAAQVSLAQQNEAAPAPTNKVLASARVYAHLEAFEWKEFLQDEELLKETGPLFGIGGEMELRLNKRLLLGLNGEFFTGEVDYDGVIQELDGTLTPAQSTTTYVGFEGGAKLGAPLAVGPQVVLKPWAGLGLRTWERTLDSSFDSRYIGDHGYIEDWFTSHGLLGATVEITVSPKAMIFATAELRLPVWTAQNIDLSNVGGPDDVELEPKARPSLFAEAGVRYKKLFISAFVETQDFDESDFDDKYGEFLQPESEARIAGARAGLWF